MIPSTGLSEVLAPGLTEASPEGEFVNITVGLTSINSESLEGSFITFTQKQNKFRLVKYRLNKNYSRSKYGP